MVSKGRKYSVTAADFVIHFFPPQKNTTPALLSEKRAGVVFKMLLFHFNGSAISRFCPLESKNKL